MRDEAGFVRISWSEAAAFRRTRCVSGLCKSFQAGGAQREGRCAGFRTQPGRGAGRLRGTRPSSLS